MTFKVFESLSIPTNEFEEIRNGVLGKFFELSDLDIDSYLKSLSGLEHLGVEERFEETICFNEKLWLDRDKVVLALLPIYRLSSFQEVPKHISQAAPFYLYSWVYAIWWREIIPKAFFSKNKEQLGDIFKMLNSEKTAHRIKAIDELLKPENKIILPDYIQNEFQKGIDKLDIAKVYRWSNSIENFMQFRMVERELKVFKNMASEGSIFANTLIRLLEKDLIIRNLWSPQAGTSRANSSIDRFRKHNPYTAGGKFYSKLLNMFEDLREQFEQTKNAISYKDLKMKQRGRRKL